MSSRPLCEFLDLLLVHGQLRGPLRPVPRDPVHGVVLHLPPSALGNFLGGALLIRAAAALQGANSIEILLASVLA